MGSGRFALAATGMTIGDETSKRGPEGGSNPGRIPLTKRERQILGSLAEGLSGAQIAEQLVLSPETVRTHVRNAMAKLGASTRSQAVALAIQRSEIADTSAERKGGRRGTWPSRARGPRSSQAAPPPRRRHSPRSMTT